MAEEHEGASANERLLFAAKTDNEELLLDVFEDDEFDINFRDGLGNTALHYAARNGSTSILEHLLSCDGCDVDLQNRTEHDTPLHMAIKYLDDPEQRNFVAVSLLEAGADTYVKDKNGDTIIDLLSSSPSFDEIRRAIQQSRMENSIPAADIIGEDDDNADGEFSSEEEE